VSATATVGLSRALTPKLDLLGKLTIIFTMYFGRIGPISLALAFNTRRQKQNAVKDPVEDISVG
jgi:trk system potassium uptake protein TrkH